MSFFGFSSKKEVAEKEAAARAQGRTAGAQSVIWDQRNNLANIGKGSQIKFSVPYFDVFDPRFSDFGVPVSVHGTLVYQIYNMDEFNRLNKSASYSDSTFETNLKSQLAKYIKSVVSNAPADNGIQVTQIERKILEISELVQRMVSPKIESTFGINVRSLDIASIMVDKSSRGYRELKAVTTDLEKDTLKMRSTLNLDAMKRQQEMSLGGQEELQSMQLEHQRETLRIQREELQRASRLQTETNFLGAHQANLNAQVGMAQQRQSMFGNIQSVGTPQMPGMFGMPQMPEMPNAVPQVQYMVGVNGQPQGPFDWNGLQQLVQQGQLTHQSQVWKQGMAAWAMAGEVQELTPLFNGQTATSNNGMPPMK